MAMNESAASFKWLFESLALDSDDSPCREAWARVSQSMRATSQYFVSTQDWISDFWICKGAKSGWGGLMPTWNPPERIDAWQTVSHDRLPDSLRTRARKTDHSAVDAAIASASSPPGNPRSHAVGWQAGAPGKHREPQPCNLLK